MKTHLFLTIGSCALALGACSKAEEQKPRPGKYKPEISLTTIDIPGLPEAVKDQAKGQLQAMFAAQTGGEQCVGKTDKEQWKKLAEQMGKGLGGKCETVRNASTESSVDVELKCSGSQLGNMTTTIKGAAESESYGIDVNLTLEKTPVGEPGKLGVKLLSKRVGDC